MDSTGSLLNGTFSNRTDNSTWGRQTQASNSSILEDIAANTTEYGIRCLLDYYPGSIMVALNAMVSVVGTVGNILLIMAILTRPKLRVVSNWFIMNLAIADLLVTMCAQPLLSVLQYSRIQGACADHVEFAFRLVGNLSCAVSVLTLCIISIERCVVILKPFNHRDILTKPVIFTMLATVWVVPIVYTALRMTISKRVTSYFTVVIFAMGYITIVVTYTLIFIKVLRQSKQRAQLTSSGSQSERRLATTIALVIIIFTVSWTPLLYLRMTQPKMNYGVLFNISRTIALSNSAVNFLIYALRNPDFRRAYKELLLCECKPRRDYKPTKPRSSSNKSSQSTSASDKRENLALQGKTSPPPTAP